MAKEKRFEVIDSEGGFSAPTSPFCRTLPPVCSIFSSVMAAQVVYALCRIRTANP